MTRFFAVRLSAVAIAATALFAAVTVPEIKWKTGDRSRPLPPKVTPGSASTDDRAGAAPSDAVVLFDGKDLSAWQDASGKPARWTVGSGYFEVAAKTGDLVSKQAFGDMQLHIEWATPSPTHGKDQEPGNSGVFLASTYEVQVLDSYENVTYADGQASAIYCEYPPLVNASLPPGRWQAYDIVFHGPRFSDSGELLRTATVTVLHNGVLVQDHVTLTGPTAYMQRPPYQKHAVKMPLKLQDHGQPVRYRNVWIRELAEGS
jgi:hypothetical protein